MIFVPCIGIDNHWKSVTFSAPLLDKEDVENFTWACDAFLSIMGHPPKCIVTDQCPVMKIAIAKKISRSEASFLHVAGNEKFSNKGNISL